jgi:hypothetical protein
MNYSHHQPELFNAYSGLQKTVVGCADPHSQVARPIDHYILSIASVTGPRGHRVMIYVTVKVFRTRTEIAALVVEQVATLYPRHLTDPTRYHHCA